MQFRSHSETPYSVHLEHKNGEEFKGNEIVWGIMWEGGIQGFMESQGYDENWPKQVASTCGEGRVTIDGLQFTISYELITAAIGMVVDGMRAHPRKRHPLEA